MLRIPSLLCVCACVCVAWTTAQLAQLGLNDGDICRQQGDVLWKCARPEECPQANVDFRKGIRPEVCKYQGRVPIICCNPGITTPHKKSKSEQKCEEYAKRVFVKVKDGDEEYEYDTCAAAEPLITMGTKAAPREFPHMALIGRGNKNSIKWVCGGTLISEKFVLSAAHCTNTYSGPVGWVRLGEYNTTTSEDNRDGTAMTADYEIEERINHPLYVNTSVYYDIALYRLKKVVKFSEYVRPACLQTRHHFPKSYALATGWGKTDIISKPSDVLLKVNLTLTPRKECSDFYQPVIGPKLKNGIMDDTQVCAGDLKTGKDTCNGDSGGPLQLRLKKPYCMYSVIGVVSFGPADCGDGSRPGVYTRVSHYVSWIERIVWP